MEISWGEEKKKRKTNEMKLKAAARDERHLSVGFQIYSFLI